jgi:hypothetical protein
MYNIIQSVGFEVFTAVTTLKIAVYLHGATPHKTAIFNII